MKYIINNKTNLLIFKNYNTLIYEDEKELTINKEIIKIIDESCCYYGSNYSGRKKSAKYLLNNATKLPIIISERDLLIMFPLESSRHKNGTWILYNSIKSYKKVKKNVEITFNNDKKFILEVSYNIFNNQVLKCSRLLAIYMLRK
ncbi:MAG: hypothetical protein E7172_01860 [Firmicutes bacterium]|nr:hypothetical protein [Bacillota bacterium]